MHKRALRVAIQGDAASFHEIAALSLYNQPLQLIYCQTFSEVFESLKAGRADRALVAVSNSAHGIIGEVSELIKSYPLIAEKEYPLAIKQHLIGIAGTRLSDITTVISHPVALSQCSVYLSDTMAERIKVPYHDTAAAVEYVKQKSNTSVVAIGSNAAAALHGLEILVEAIQDDPNNVTVFRSFRYRRDTTSRSPDQTHVDA